MSQLQQKLIKVGDQEYFIENNVRNEQDCTIYTSKNKKTGEKVVIKQITIQSQQELEFYHKLYKCPQSHINTIRCISQENQNLIIVMEFGEDYLYQYMTENPEFQTLSKDQRNQIFYQMVQAVKELHDLGYFHRDLKPENFVVFKKDANGFVKTKLIDLGLCKLQQNQMRHTMNVGTPYYMAPEIFDGFLLYDHSVDSWALGCIWYEIMTEKTFFEGNDPNSVFYNIRYATQQQIDQTIESSQMFNQQEKYLLKRLIFRDANNRIQVKDLAQQLQVNQNNNQIYPNFNNNQNVNVFKTPNPQFPQFQNQNQFNQPTNFNVIQQNQNNNQPFQPFQPQQNLHQMEDWKQKQQQLMKQEYEQKLKIEFEQLKQIEIERIKKEEEEKQKQKLLEQQQMLEQQNEIKWKQMEEELRKKNEEEQRKIELDQQKLRELKIEQELKIQFQQEEQKKRNEEEKQRKEEEIQKQNEERLKNQLKLKEEELQTQIARQLQQEYLIKYNQELQQKQQQQRQEMEKIFNETKNKIKKLIKNNKESIEKFIQSLEEKSQEKLIIESKTIVPQMYKEFQEMTQNFVNQFKQQVTKIEEIENAIQKMDDLAYLNQIQELEKQLFESNQKITQDQINAVNGFTQKYNELILQLTSKKQLKEQLENQKKQQFNQREQLQTQSKAYIQQIIDLKSNFENCQKNTQQIINQLGDNQILIQSKQINDKFQNIIQQVEQFEQQVKQFTNLEISIQIMQYNQMNSQLFRIIEELKQLTNQQQQLNLNVQNIFQNLKTQMNEKIQHFQDQVFNFNLCQQKYTKDQEQLNQELNRLQSQDYSFLIKQKMKELQELVQQIRGQLQQFENSLSQLLQNFNKNMMNQCQQLISDMNNKQYELTNLDTKIIQLNQQLGRIINQQNQIVQLKEENQRKFFQWNQQQQTLFVQFQNFSHLSGNIKQQVDLLLQSFNNLKNEFIMALQKLDSQSQVTEEQLRQYLDDNQRVSNTFMQKFEEKKSAAQDLLQTLLQIQAVQDEKQKLFNQFNVQCNQIKYILKQFKFDNNIQVFNQIRQHPCQLQMEQCLLYFKECDEKQNENQQVYYDFIKLLQGKNSFSNQKNIVREKLNNFYDNSGKSIDSQRLFYNSSIKPYLKGNFDQIEQGDDEHFSKLEKCREIQIRVDSLNSENSDQFQKTLAGQIDDKEFMNKVQQDLEELKNYQKDLQQINVQEIQQFSLKIPNKINSWFIQMLLITIIQSYQKQGLIKRKYSKVDEKGDQEQRIKFSDEQSKAKNIMLKCQSYLDSKQYSELEVQELIKNQKEIKESVEKDLNEIKTKNRVKLRGFVKNQETIKEIIELTQVQEFCQIIIFHKLKNLMIK